MDTKESQKMKLEALMAGYQAGAISRKTIMREAELGQWRLRLRKMGKQEPYVPNTDCYVAPLLRASRNDYIRKCCKLAVLSGDIAEFGVFEGATFRVFAEIFPDRTIYGFDSCQGLPERMPVGDNHGLPAGQFKTGRPELLPNQQFIEGWFKDTVQPWADTRPEGFHLALVHMDADLYSSTREALIPINPFIVPGTILMFDEFYSWTSDWYSAWREGEYKALIEWLSECDRKVDALLRYQPMGRQPGRICFVVTQ